MIRIYGYAQLFTLSSNLASDLNFEASLKDSNNNRNKSDLFRSMIPTIVRKSAKKYEERLSTLLSKMDKQCREKNHVARESLAAIGLPASIEATVQSVGLPDSVWAKVDEIKQKGGVSVFETIIAVSYTHLTLPTRDLV